MWAADSPTVARGTRNEEGALEDERALALRARTDSDAFTFLYRRYVGAIHAFAYRRSGSRQIAEDVTAATFERAWRAMPTFEWKGSGFEPWLYRIAARELAAWYRSEGRAHRPRAQLGLRALAPQAQSADFDSDDDRERTAEELAAMRAALPHLAPRYEEAVTLRFLSGLSNEQAAEAMNCSRAVMAVTLHRALAALRKQMARDGQR